jgi:hypothetical protein
MSLDIRPWGDLEGSRRPVGAVGADGRATQLTDVFGSADSISSTPQVFLVEMPPERVIPPHFHGVPQFQLVVDGSGSLGRHRIEGQVLHYTDAWTSYGPIESGPSGLSFFTIRHSPDVGAHYMPGQRSERRGTAGEQLTVALGPGRGPRGHGAARPLMERAADALWALDIALPPAAEWPPAPEPDRFDYLLVVMEGALRRGDSEYGPWSWASARRVKRAHASCNCGFRIRDVRSA